MSRIVIPTVPAAGHFGPMRIIAADLVRRGHHVTMLSGEEFRAAAEQVGAAFEPLTGRGDTHVAELVSSPERLALASGLPQLEWDLRHLLVGTIADKHRDLQRVIALAGDEPVIVVGDYGFHGTTPLLFGAPGPRPKAFVGIGTVPFTLSSADTAPMGMGLPPDSSEEGRARNREAYAFLHEQALGDVQKYFLDVLAELGAYDGPVPFFLDAPILRVDRFLQLSVEELSYQRSDTPAHVRFVGALPAAPAAGTPKPSWWADVEEARTVVVVTQGTVANQDLGDLVEPTLAALADLPVLVVAATGRDVRLSDVPANARVASFIPFDDLLPHTDVLVTNGGFGGVQQSLRNGVPMVLAGQTEDKLEGNVRTAATGAAINLMNHQPAKEDLRVAVQTVLGNADYRTQAQRIATEYAGLDALGSIAAAVEELAAR
jgi:UDP:flavonoid glycosyltransferase YjiC (YdhE family)